MLDGYGNKIEATTEYPVKLEFLGNMIYIDWDGMHRENIRRMFAGEPALSDEEISAFKQIIPPKIVNGKITYDWP